MRGLTERAAAAIRIDAAWLAVDSIDMRTGVDRLLASVVQVFGAAHAHHGYLFTNARASRIRLLVPDGFSVWCAARRLTPQCGSGRHRSGRAADGEQRTIRRADPGSALGAARADAVKNQDLMALSPSALAELASRMLAHIEAQSLHIDTLDKHAISEAQGIKWREAKIESILFQPAG